MCIAVAFVLSCIKLFRMPQGGSVTPAAMMPLVLFALAFGPGQGIVVGCAFGLLQLIEDFYVIHPVQLLVDYPMAYAALALGCVALWLPEKYERFRLPMAVLLGYFGRYLMASISGAVFFAEYAGEQNAWVYSLGYNLSYLGTEALIASALAFMPGFGRILKLMRSKK
jgi:thiamine transporter